MVLWISPLEFEAPVYLLKEMSNQIKFRTSLVRRLSLEWQSNSYSFGIKFPKVLIDRNMIQFPDIFFSTEEDTMFCKWKRIFPFPLYNSNHFPLTKMECLVITVCFSYMITCTTTQHSHTSDPMMRKALVYKQLFMHRNRYTQQASI